MEFIVGQPIYVGTSNTYNRFISATVTKVTPSGQVNVQYLDGTTERFSNHSRSMAEYSRRYLDTRMSFQERTADIARDARLDAAATELAKVILSGAPRSTWGKEGLAAEVERLQALLNNARAKVEAV